MIISAWVVLAMAVPLLLLGEKLVRSSRWLARLNIPAPVASGLLFALVVLAGNVTGAWPLRLEVNVSAPFWTWIVTTHGEWAGGPQRSVALPFLVGFFTCVGLNASWALARHGSFFLMVFFALAAGLAVLQNVTGILLAKALGQPAILGLVCGSATLTGGHGTALGFAPEFAKLGLEGAAEAAMAAATFGLVAGALLGGPLAGRLITRRQLRSTAPAQAHLALGQAAAPGFLTDLRNLAGYGRAAALHLLLLLACIKTGAYVSALLQQLGISFPVYMGALLLGVVVRNGADATGRGWVRTEIVDILGAVCLGIFLSIAMMSLNLIELAQTAVPMLVILSVQVILMAVYARFVSFPALGRDFDAAIMAGGHCGFGLGATANAVATMKALVDTFGASPRAFLVVPVVGAFMIDLFNAFNLTFFLNLYR